MWEDQEEKRRNVLTDVQLSEEKLCLITMITLNEFQRIWKISTSDFWWVRAPEEPGCLPDCHDLPTGVSMTWASPPSKIVKHSFQYQIPTQSLQGLWERQFSTVEAVSQKTTEKGATYIIMNYFHLNGDAPQDLACYLWWLIPSHLHWPHPPGKLCSKQIWGSSVSVHLKHFPVFNTWRYFGEACAFILSLCYLWYTVSIWKI